jgi:hypothetical protein
MQKKKKTAAQKGTPDIQHSVSDSFHV